MVKISRNKFLKSTAALTALGILGSSCEAVKEKENTKFSNTPEYEWKMVTTWPPNFPVVGEGCNLLADWIYKMSAGRLKITTYGSGELVPGLESFDAVSMGSRRNGTWCWLLLGGKVSGFSVFYYSPIWDECTGI